jgi:hypothetical protein
LLAAGGVLYGLPQVGGLLQLLFLPACRRLFVYLPATAFKVLVVPKVSSGGVARVIAAS